jgi:hypothetical protein
VFGASSVEHDFFDLGGTFAGAEDRRRAERHGLRAVDPATSTSTRPSWTWSAS